MRGVERDSSKDNPWEHPQTQTHPLQTGTVYLFYTTGSLWLTLLHGQASKNERDRHQHLPLVLAHELLLLLVLVVVHVMMLQLGRQPMRHMMQSSCVEGSG